MGKYFFDGTVDTTQEPSFVAVFLKGETFDIFYFIQRSLEVTKVAHSVGGSRLSFSHNLGTYCLGGEGRKKFLFINRFPLRFYQRSNSRKHHQRTVHCTAIPTLFLTHLVNVVFSGEASLNYGTCCYFSLLINANHITVWKNYQKGLIYANKWSAN